MNHSFLSRFFEGLRRGVTDLWFILSVVVGVTLFLLLVSYHVTDPAWNTSGTNEGVRNWLGGFGAYTADILITSFGYAIYLLPIGIVWIGWESVRNRYTNIEILIWKLLGLIVTIIALCGILSIQWPNKINSLAVTTGGYLGQKMSVALLTQLSIQWVMLIYTLFFILGLTLLFEINWLKFIDKIGYVVITGIGWTRDKLKNKDGRSQQLGNYEKNKDKRSRLKQKLEPGMNLNEDSDGTDYLSTLDRNQELRWSDYKKDSFNKKDVTVPERINLQEHYNAQHKNILKPSSDSQESDCDLSQNQTTHPVAQDNIFPNVGDSQSIQKQFPNPDVVTQEIEELYLTTGNFYYTELPTEKVDGKTLDNDQSDFNPSAVTEKNHSHAKTNRLPSAPLSIDKDQRADTPENAYFDTDSNYINDHAIEDDTKKLKVSLFGNPFNKQDNATITESTHSGEYQLPPLNILSLAPVSKTEYSQEQLLAMAVTVQDALKNYKIEATVVNIQVGPVVTRLELDLAPGIKVSQISNLDKDLARSLSVRSVRVVEVIPGKPYIGLEIPNKDRETVHLRNILESDEYRQAISPLTVVLGADISGQPVVDNLEKMPHLLVAGTTGSGKSVAINVMLASMLYKATPEDLRLILIDPKMLEMSMYEDIPHLLTPVVTDMNDAENALRWAVAEMERRYELMAAFRVRNIAGFNQVIREKQSRNERVDDPLWKAEDFLGLAHQPPQIKPLPMIVIVIDELADMMMAVGKKVEELIARIAQKARAAGIHLILATQRPSVDVITGLIKANIPGRLAFQVSSKIDSRTILDQQGAEALLGYGDGLFFPPRSSQPQRIHGALIEDVEVDKLTQFIKSQGKPDYEESITNPIPGAAMGAFGANEKSNDPAQDTLYDEACQLVIEEGKASISWLQRRLSIGYNRSARLMESMEEAGIVSAPERSGSRRLLVGPHSGSDK